MGPGGDAPQRAIGSRKVTALTIGAGLVVVLVCLALMMAHGAAPVKSRLSDRAACGASGLKDQDPATERATRNSPD